MAKKIVLIIAAALVVAGLGLLLAVLGMNHWDISSLGGKNYEVVTHEVAEDFNLIQIAADAADITILPSEDGKCRVIGDETERELYSVSVSNQTLLIQKLNLKKWYEFFNFGHPSELIVYLPKQAYTSLLIDATTGDVELPKEIAFGSIGITTSTGDVTCCASASDSIQIRTSTGDVTAADLSADTIGLAVSTGTIKVSRVDCAGDLSVAVSTGRTELESVRCGKLISNGSTGRLVMTDVIASGEFFIERSTGDVVFDRCDAAELYIETGTGDVGGTLLSEKVFITDTDTGDVRVPKTTTGGKCEITTDTGDIDIEIEK